MKTKNLYWIELSAKKLYHNIQLYRNNLPSHNQIAAVIKSNAYGHGILPVAHLLEQNSLVHMFCTANTQEALLLRQGGITKPIMVIGLVNSPTQEIVAHNIQVTIYDLALVQELDFHAGLQKKTALVHIKIDTGLSRMGIFPEQLADFIKVISEFKNVSIASVYSHLAKAHDQDSAQAQEQKFCSITHAFPVHLGASKANPRELDQKYTLTRVGIGIYGYNHQQHVFGKHLLPVMSLKSGIAMIKTIPAGTNVGYDHTYTALRETRIAVLSMGHGDGINLHLSNQGQVIICDKLAPMIGRISMNYTVVDVTDIPEATVYDSAIWLGQSKNHSISLYDWEKITGLSATHLAVNLKPHIPRIIV